MKCPRCGWKINTMTQEKAKEISASYPKAFRPWSAEDDQTLVSLVSLGRPLHELSKLLGRQPTAIKKRIELLGIIIPQPEQTPTEAIPERTYYDKP